MVLDTNVLVSAALKQNSTPASAVRLVEQHDVLLKSGDTERQLFEVIARPYLGPLIGYEPVAWLRSLMATAELVTITERIAACRDPTDDKFLELAVSGHADVIVGAGNVSRWPSQPESGTRDRSLAEVARSGSSIGDKAWAQQSSM